MSKTKGGKKKQKSGPTRQVIVEPVRKSILDVINTNLKIANRVAFLHRLIYVGEYSFDNDDEHDIASAIEENYKQCNSGYVVEPLSGILLYYDHHFCYMAEAPERVLNKHVTLLFEQYAANFKKIKLLSAVHHIKGRFWNEWIAYHGRPPQRVEEIDPESNLEQSMWYVKDCCEKLYKFANAYIAAQTRVKSRLQINKDGDKDGDLTEDEEEIKVETTRYKSKSILVERDYYSEFLPEIKLLDFLVNCKYLEDLKIYQESYRRIGQSMDFSRKAWPAPTTMVPYNVFDTFYDPIEDLPTEQDEHGEEAKEEVSEAEPETEEQSTVNIQE